jgi:hypothetical protein
MACKFFSEFITQIVPDLFDVNPSKLDCSAKVGNNDLPLRSSPEISGKRPQDGAFYVQVTSLRAKLVGLIVLGVVTAFAVTPLAVQISAAANPAPAGCHHQTPAPATPEPVGHHCCVFDHHPAALTGFTPDFSGPHDFSHLLPVDSTLITRSHVRSSGILIGSSPPGTAPLRI